MSNGVVLTTRPSIVFSMAFLSRYVREAALLEPIELFGEKKFEIEI